MNLLEAFGVTVCRGCGKRGEEMLCKSCLEFLVKTGRARKILYEEKMVLEPSEVFGSVRYLGDRDGILGELIEEYKYMCARELGEMIAEVVEKIYLERRFRRRRIYLVPMPAARKHIRMRGFDHIDLICRKIERRNKRVEVVRLLRREKETVQVGKSGEVRQEQAKEAVEVDEMEVEKFLKSAERRASLGKKDVVVLVDDVWTTGSSLLFAGEKLRKAGIARLYGLVITKNRTKRSPVVRRMLE